MPILRPAPGALHALLLVLPLCAALVGCGGGGGGGTIDPPPPPPPTDLEIGQDAPLFVLEDVNPASPSFGQIVGPPARLAFGTAWYFAQASSSASQSRFATLEALLDEARLEDPVVQLDVLGVNELGQEAGNPNMVAGRLLPWLQDDADMDAWGLWAMEPEDLVILDGFGRVFALYNLLIDDLDDPLIYAAIKQDLLDAARAEPGPLP